MKNNFYSTKNRLFLSVLALMLTQSIASATPSFYSIMEEERKMVYLSGINLVGVNHPCDASFQSGIPVKLDLIAELKGEESVNYYLELKVLSKEMISPGVSIQWGRVEAKDTTKAELHWQYNGDEYCYVPFRRLFFPIPEILIGSSSFKCDDTITVLINGKEDSIKLPSDVCSVVKKARRKLLQTTKRLSRTDYLSAEAQRVINEKKRMGVTKDIPLKYGFYLDPSGDLHKKEEGAQGNLKFYPDNHDKVDIMLKLKKMPYPRRTINIKDGRICDLKHVFAVCNPWSLNQLYTKGGEDWITMYVSVIVAIRDNYLEVFPVIDSIVFVKSTRHGISGHYHHPQYDYVKYGYPLAEFCNERFFDSEGMIRSNSFFEYQRLLLLIDDIMDEFMTVFSDTVTTGVVE